MSRKRTFNISRFDGGITNELRNTQDLSKCAFVSHFDIYREPNKMYPMPGYVLDNATKAGEDVAHTAEPDDPNGMEKYNCTAFYFHSRNSGEAPQNMAALGTRADGTGWKIITKTNPEATCWTPDDAINGKSAEGSETLTRGTYFTSDDPGSLLSALFLQVNNSRTYIGEWNGSTFNNQLAEVSTLSTTQTSGRMIAEVAPDSNVYTQRLWGSSGVWLQDGSPAEAKSTSLFPYDLQAGNDQLGIIGGVSNFNRESRLLLWDTGSTLVDQNILLGNGTGRALGYIDGIWIAVTDENDRDYTDAGMPSIHVQYVSGGTPYTLARVLGKSTTGKKVQPVRAYFRRQFLFEGKLATNAAGTEFKQGIWAVGRSTANSPFALSLLFDTTNLGAIEDMKCYDNYAYFIHGDNYSISRTDNLISGTFDQTAVYESLFFGSDTPYNKTLNGLSVHTEELPSGATVVAKYRFDDDDSWTTMGTASTEGDQIHHFTNASGSPIGTFKEIQFRVEVTGNAPIKDIYISLEEQDSTPYDS